MTDSVTSPTSGEERPPAAPPSVVDAPIGVPIGPESPILIIMETTRALRRLRPDPVPDELLRDLIKAATWAPTGTNAQTEAFILVTDRAVIADLARIWRRVVDNYLLTAVATQPALAAEPAMIRLHAARSSTSAITSPTHLRSSSPAMTCAPSSMRGGI